MIQAALALAEAAKGLAVIPDTAVGQAMARKAAGKGMEILMLLALVQMARNTVRKVVDLAMVLKTVDKDSAQAVKVVVLVSAALGKAGMAMARMILVRKAVALEVRAIRVLEAVQTISVHKAVLVLVRRVVGLASEGAQVVSALASAEAILAAQARVLPQFFTKIFQSI